MENVSSKNIETDEILPGLRSRLPIRITNQTHIDRVQGAHELKLELIDSHTHAGYE